MMNLDACLSYAKENSITLKQAKLEVENSTVDESSAKSAFLPSVNGTITQGFNNSPFETAVNEKMNKYSGSYGVDLSMTLFNGGENSTTLKQSRVSTEIAKMGVEQQEDILEISITQLYVEILYAIEKISVVENSIALAKKNLEYGDKLKSAGGMNEAEYAQLVSAEATEQYNLVVAQTSLSNKYVQLKHLLEITDDSVIRVDASQLTNNSLSVAIPSVGEVYAAALESRPEIMASTLSIKSAEMDEKIARAAYMPTLSLTAGVGVNHVTGTSYTYSYQLKNNYSNAVGLTLSVPIFNRFDTRNAVTKSKNNTKIANLAYTDNTKNLYQTIETLHNNAINAESMYNVSQLKLKALEKSLELVTKQYEVGMKNIIELLTEQDEYQTSSQDFLESKYTFILNRALLEYYKSGIIKL